MSQHHEQQQERRRLKNQTKALYQAQRRANPVVRSLEQSSTGRRRIAREVLGVRDHESEQWAVGREEPGMREQRREQEQPANTRQRAVAREEPGVLWLQREYRLHMQVEYTLYEDYLVAQNQRQNIHPKYTARLSDLLLLNWVKKSFVHNDAWYLPENPEFEYGCLINIRGSILYFTISV